MFCITFQAVIELSVDNLIVYRKVPNFGNYNCAMYCKSYILPDELRSKNSSRPFSFILVTSVGLFINFMGYFTGKNDMLSEK